MTEIFAHRGSSGTRPENTFAAFNEAKRVGADGIEIDVHFTKDNQLAVIHDHTIDRTTNGSGLVRDYTLRDLQQFDAGSWFSESFHKERIPSLGEVLQWIKNTNLLLNIELKYAALDYEEFERTVVKELEAYNLVDRVIVSSFNHVGLKEVSKLNRQIECAVLYMERLYEPWNYAKTIGATAIHPYKIAVDLDLVIQATNNNYPIRVFNVNEKETMQKLIHLGCSGMITDYPEKALKIKQLHTVNRTN